MCWLRSVCETVGAVKTESTKHSLHLTHLLYPSLSPSCQKNVE